MSFWHSATFSNDGSKVLFSDEWGGESRAVPRHRQPSGRQRALHYREREDAVQELYKMPAAQTGSRTAWRTTVR